MNRRNFARHNGKCPTCGVVLLRASELADITDLPHSTVALRLKKAGIAPAAREGKRALYISAQVLPLLLRNDGPR